MDGGWICPGCGYGEMPASMMICPVCGMVKPEPAESSEAKSAAEDDDSEGD